MLANVGLARTRDPGGSEGRFDPSAVDPAAASFMKTRFDRREAANSNLCAWLVAGRRAAGACYIIPGVTHALANF